MSKFKIFISVAIFSFLLIGTSIVKNQTREIEKKIFLMNKNINLKQKDLYETQLDFSYLTSPAMIEKRIKRLDSIQYFPIEYSKIFLSIENLIDLENKIANQNNFNEKKSQKK
tara:strand:- start:613 stop:951 length:339 start_codon:yes stop_codon:yes gene_type:complete